MGEKTRPGRPLADQSVAPLAALRERKVVPAQQGATKREPPQSATVPQAYVPVETHVVVPVATDHLRAPLAPASATTVPESSWKYTVPFETTGDEETVRALALVHKVAPEAASIATMLPDARAT